MNIPNRLVTCNQWWSVMWNVSSLLVVGKCNFCLFIFAFSDQKYSTYPRGTLKQKNLLHKKILCLKSSQIRSNLFKKNYWKPKKILKKKLENPKKILEKRQKNPLNEDFILENSFSLKVHFPSYVRTSKFVALTSRHTSLAFGTCTCETIFRK